ncbi:hypothetical protein DAPPUDRAFT_346777, partial [Daphnia pulex]
MPISTSEEVNDTPAPEYESTLPTTKNIRQTPAPTTSDDTSGDWTIVLGAAAGLLACVGIAFAVLFVIRRRQNSRGSDFDDLVSPPVPMLTAEKPFSTMKLLQSTVSNDPVISKRELESKNQPQNNKKKINNILSPFAQSVANYNKATDVDTKFPSTRSSNILDSIRYNLDTFRSGFASSRGGPTRSQRGGQNRTRFSSLDESEQRSTNASMSSMAESLPDVTKKSALASYVENSHFEDESVLSSLTSSVVLRERDDLQSVATGSPTHSTQQPPTFQLKPKQSFTE